MQRYDLEKAESLLNANDLRVEDLCRESLLAFGGYMFPKYEPSWFHRLIANKLQQVEQGKCKRLIISMPPRHGKSLTTSEFFPAWYMGHHPDNEVIFVTYNQQLASDFGKKVRDLMNDETYQQVFPGVKVSDDTASKNRLSIVHPGIETKRDRPGSYTATGVNGTLTGKGAHLILIDDPYKSRKDADSEAWRKNVWEFYNAVAQTRLYPGAAIVIIMTRWREDDLYGQIKKEHFHEGWEELILPAIDEDNRPLWPERFSLEWYKDKKRTLSSREWQSLYQNDPLREAGNLLQRSWFKLWPNDKPMPEFRMIIQSFDGAYGEKEENDFSAMTVWGLAEIDYGNKEPPQTVAILLDCWKTKVTFNKLRKLVAEEYSNMYGPKDKPVDLLIIEDKASGISLGQELRYLGANVLKYNPGTRDKVSRAHMISHLLEVGRVYIPESRVREGQFADFATPFIEEALAFPNGEHDDMVDTMTQALSYMSKHGWLRMPAMVERPKPEVLPPKKRLNISNNPYAA